MPLPSVEELVTALNQKRRSDINRSLGAFFRVDGVEPLVPGLLAAFPRIRGWIGRNAILFWLVRFARSHPQVVDLAIEGLRDPAYMVRMQATAILAYSLRRDVLPDLAKLQTHKDKKTRDDAAAAVDAIRHQNHNYWLDRDHKGNLFWGVNPGDNQHGEQ